MKISESPARENKALRVVGLIQGREEDPLSRAGVNFRFYKEFRRRATVVKVIDVEPAGLRRISLALRSFHPDRKRWARRFYENPVIFMARTRLAEEQLHELDNSYDVILQDGAMWMPGRRNDHKPLLTYHDSNVILGSSGGPYAQGSHYRGETLRRAIALEKEVYNRASRVVTFSEWVRNSMVRDFQVPEGKTKVAKPGVNFDIPTDFQKRYDERTILFVGRNFERKGGPVLLRAFRRVREMLKRAKLIILGCSPPVSQDGVIVKGLIPREREDEIEELYQSASVFALPSRFEPFGLVFLEAMAYRLPCVGTNICAMPEIIGDGECGFLVRPDDHKGLAEKLIILLENPKLMRQMGERGYSKVTTDYTWEQFARSIHRYCKEIV
ncbi:MAG: glycosyltransferase family 1 protein [Candidatus Abyssobacteria bacterium SURF_5]|uniref:Glycosyltransferase family 1 protein n=1 Tax=Abyssobacteria bacterium (strain SURF_5) TaxID=2093360 RepID=A0A3A4NNT9_ABYX5|nr:MAG: glycosyltransferase family 1 protein [Candidatus Abyssubacteria bacterium SURF_5]